MVVKRQGARVARLVLFIQIRTLYFQNTPLFGTQFMYKARYLQSDFLSVRIPKKILCICSIIII